jgi:hypothetical protein
MKNQIIASVLIIISSCAVNAATYTPIDLAPYQNFVSNDPVFTDRFPNGDQVLGGVPFVNLLPGTSSDPLNIGSRSFWNAFAEPRAIDIAVNVFGVTEVHTLLNTFWGEQEAGTLAHIEFSGSDGAFASIPLDGNADIRDYNNSTYANSINGTTTTQVFLDPNGQRIDKQVFYLGADFSDEILTKIRLVDDGAFEVQRLFALGLTVGREASSAVPDHGMTLALLGAASGMLGIVRKRYS